MRSKMDYDSSVLIQTTWRRHWATNFYKKYRAARKIQSVWRGFQGYTDYIFCLVDILLVQRVSRRWLAIQEARRRRLSNTAIMIQKRWRIYRSRMRLYQDLANVIRVQSVARRYLAQSAVYQRKVEKFEEAEAAIRIQAAWRGFWGYSHFVIMQFEVTKVQSLIRGVLTRRQQQFRLGCCILIQAAARRYVAKRSFDEMLFERVFVASKSIELRERLSAERIQFWWTVVQECQKEKKAALVIERFFIMVKEEVEREIIRQEKRKQEKRGKRRHRKKDNKDDQVLERVWLNAVEDGQVDLGLAPTQSTMGTPTSIASTTFTAGSRTPHARKPFASKSSISMQIKSPSGNGGTSRHRSPSPSMGMVMHHEHGDVIRHNDVLIADTRNTPSYSSKKSPSKASKQKPTPMGGGGKSIDDNDSLAFSQSEESPSLSSGKNLMKGKTTFTSRTGKLTNNISKYMNKYGIKPGSSVKSSARPSRPSSHFFADEDTDEIMTPSGKKVKSAQTFGTSPPRKGQLGPSPRHGSMMVMDRFQRQNKQPRSPSHASVESDESSFLAGEEFGMI